MGTTLPWTTVQSKLLAVFENPEHRRKPLSEICQLAGYGDWAWERAIKDIRFVNELRKWKLTVLPLPQGGPRKYAHHLDVTLAVDPEEELAKDVWDMRRLLAEYPRHRPPDAFIVDFTWIENLNVRAQVKRYLRSRLAHLKAGTFRRWLTTLRLPLKYLPPELSLDQVTRTHIEMMLVHLSQHSPSLMASGLQSLRTMLEYMAISPAWTGPRPQRMLIWPEDIPRVEKPLPRPIPPDVLEQLDGLLQQAMTNLENERKPQFLSPTAWDALLILRRTGMRFEDLAHLKAPDRAGKNGCLVQDNDGYWWIRIEHTYTKMGREHRIPTKVSDGVIAAVRRQQERAKRYPDHFHEHYLFRNEDGILTQKKVFPMLKKLSHALLHEGHPYTISLHQFRHTIATEMIEQGVDIYTVKEFLGHRSLEMTQRYIKVYLKSLKAKYDAYREKQQASPAVLHMAECVERVPPSGETDGGWVENKVGTLYRSPLPDGIGWCEHLALLDPCPTPPHCPTCPKLRATGRHLPVWENKATNLLITVEALRANPAYARAQQKQEQELAHAEKVIKTIKEEGFWDGRIHNNKTHKK